MGLKTQVVKYVARRTFKKVNQWANSPIETQNKVFEKLIKKAKKTSFGSDHSFDKIKNYTDFVKYVPVRDYEGLKPYIDRTVSGESNVLWPRKPIYFSKTSGTTSGSKFIPITKSSMPHHIRSAKEALLLYINQSGDASFIGGKMIFLQGSPKLNIKKGIAIGRLSGIVAHYVPFYLRYNRLPSWKTNNIADWEAKVEAIVDETIHQDMRLISGIPPWVKMYFERLIQKSNKPVGELFPNFSLFVYGGVNYEPYRNMIQNLVGRRVPSIELYPASEGFLAYQDQQSEKGMLLQLNSDIFYEFIESSSFFEPNPTRISLEKVIIGINYVLIISTNAGLWAYNIGDTVEFVSTDPYRIIVTGRIKHFISAFGEHVIGKEVEEALQIVADQMSFQVREFTVVPQVTPKKGLPYHEWWIEFEKAPEKMDRFSKKLDLAMCQQNSYYEDLIVGKVLRSLVVRKLPKGAIDSYMKSLGKFGGQNKPPRLSNDRKIATFLETLI